MAVPCSLSAVARVIKGARRSSSRLTDLTARLTNTAIAIIAPAIIRNDKAMIAVMITSQNNGSCGFISEERRFLYLALCTSVFVVHPDKSHTQTTNSKHQVRHSFTLPFPACKSARLQCDQKARS